MNQVQFPIRPGSAGSAPVALHDGLQQLLDCALLLAQDELARRQLGAGLAGERLAKTYGDATRALVSKFQAEHGLEPNGEVDAATAKALNGLLLPPALAAAFEAPLQPGAEGDDVALVQDMLVALGLPIAAEELQASRYGASTAAAVAAWQRERDLPATGALDLEGLRRLWGEDRSLARVVRGVIRLADGAPAPALRVTAFDRDFRSEEPLGEARTDVRGRYRISYTPAQFERAEKAGADLGLRVFGADGQTMLYATPSTELLMNAPRDAVIDVTVALAEGTLASEFERMDGELRTLVGDVPFAAIASEPKSDEGDFLSRETGLEPERIAHFVVAHRVAQLANLPPALLYALLREDGLFGIAQDRPHAVLVPVGYRSDPRAVLYEAALLSQREILGAVERAVRKRTVPPSARVQAKEALKVLAALREEAQAYVAKEMPRRILDLVEGAIEDGKADQLRALLGSFDPADLGLLFERLDGAHLFAPDARETAQGRLKLGELLGFNVGLVDEVAASLDATTPDKVRQLARLERREWTELLSRSTSRATVGGRPIDPALARRQSSLIVRRFEQAYPTAAFSAQLARRRSPAVPNHAELAAFLDRHPGFELRQHKLVPFLKQEGVDPATVPPAVLHGVERLQRVFQLAGNYARTEGLLAAGYGAAADIVAAGRSRFVEDARSHAGMGEAQAQALFATAQHVNLAAVMTATTLRALRGPAALEGPPALAPAIARIVTEQPDLAALFGPADACASSHCQSIYGPAAYFADVMGFLRHRLVRDSTTPSAPAARAKDVLIERRPDLGEIDLNCANAEVPVPHIDIVCELAEHEIAPDPGFLFVGPAALAAGKPPAALLDAVRARGFEIGDDALLYGGGAPDHFVLRTPAIVVAVTGPGPNWNLRRLRQTHGTAQERAAAPEYVSVPAYSFLVGAKAAFGLPFDLFHTETRAFLAAAGIDRAALMEALAPAAAPPPPVAAEALGLAPSEHDLVFLPAPGDQAQIWSTAPAPAAPTMARLDRFIQRTGLEYGAVGQLLAGRYVKAASDLFIRHLDSSCHLEAKEIANLDEAALDRIHRLLRLARKTGLPVRDLDRLAAAPRLGGGDLGPAALHALADLSRLSAELHVGLGTMIAWLDVIPTDGAPSEHALLFQNRAATGPLDRGLEPDAIRANEIAEAAVPGSGRRLAALAPDLATAYGLRAPDLALLLERLAAPALFNGAPALSFRSLAALHGRIGLMRALGLQAADLVALERLSGIDPLAGAAALLRFVRAARAIQARGVAFGELEYRLARTGPDNAARDLPDSQLRALLESLNKDLVAAARDNRSPYDDSLAALEQAAAFEAMLQRQPELDRDAVAALADMVRVAVPPAGAVAAAKAALSGPLAPLLDEVAAVAAIDAIVAAPSDDTRRKLLLKLVMDALADAGWRGAARSAASAALARLPGATPELSAVILGGRAPLWRGARLPLADGSMAALARLLTDRALAIEGADLAPAAVPDLYRALRLAHAVGGLAAPFKPDPATVAFMFEQGAALGWLDLDGTPFEAGRPPVPLARWLELADTFDLIAQYPPAPLPGAGAATVGATDVFMLALAAGPDTGPLLDALAARAGWPRELAGDAAAHLGFTLADYRNGATWRALGRAVDLVHALGGTMADAVALAAPALTAADSRAARRLLRARYREADWFGALKAIMDPIREKKRDALVAYLLATNPDLESPADLYDYLLTDTQWSARMPSSRLVHAHATVQLFIQRCLSGEEPHAVADREADQDWNAWDWMKNYRLWEVPRKVFVEPQYYLRSEWRDDKTEAFAAFEQGLMQNELNDENINAAFEGYLDRLDEIAFLEVLATCYDFEHDDMHIFARTKSGEPRAYFHRVLQRERVWTPWRRLELDITGEHLIAFYRNRRLFLAWATFHEHGVTEQQAQYPVPSPGGGDQALPQPLTVTEIGLAVSEYTGKRWLPRRVAETPLVTAPSRTALDRGQVVLAVTPDPARFTLDVYLASKSGGLGRLGYFLLTGCKGYPETVADARGHYFALPQFVDAPPRAQRRVEADLVAGDTLEILGALGGSGKLFQRTPGRFRVTYPSQASELDRLATALINVGHDPSRDYALLFFGTMMPFFFEDNEHGYVLIPAFYGAVDDTTGTRTTKSFSNVRHLLLDATALARHYLALLAAAATPEAKAAVLAQLAADPEYARLLKEYDAYHGTRFGYLVRNFHHPRACRLRERFFEGGPAALLARATQLEQGAFVFADPAAGYAPTPLVTAPYPREEMEFGRDCAYADVNWELAVHIPRLVSATLQQAGQFDAAETWLRTMFDPRGTPGLPTPQRYWNTRPFFERTPAQYAAQAVDALLTRVARDPAGAVDTELADTILEWRRNPFKPFLVARGRTVAFQQAIASDTIRMHIARGDQHFRNDTLEELVLAELDYTRAGRLLGPRPHVVPPAVETPPETYNQLESSLDNFGNALRRLENLLPDLSSLPHGGAELPPPPLTLEALYFSVPPSDKLFELWDLLDERQFNLRNSRTIDGVERELSLFAPPLSVEALIQAVAAGIPVSALLANLGAPRPPYRFRSMLQHALALAEAAAGFSRALEQASASHDNEALAQLRARHESHLLDEQARALQLEIDNAGNAIASAEKTRQLQQDTQAFYAARPYMNSWESAATDVYGAAVGVQAAVAIGYIASGGLALVPSFVFGGAGFGGSPQAAAKTGGESFSASVRDLAASTLGAIGAVLDKTGSMLEHQGSYTVRKADWDHSAAMAAREIERADIEIKVAQLRKSIAEEQLRVHGTRREQAAAEETFLKTKFTSAELFDWQVQMLGGLSRQMYKLAFEAASAAERCFNFELGSIDAFVRSGQRNDARRGLLASENLSADLRRMEHAYYSGHVRELEIVKHLSLARLDPLALLALRTSGRCRVQVPEAVFDLDHRGHYFRRIKALSFSVPCITGPYGSVPLKVTQLANRVRVSTARKPMAASDAEAYAEDAGNDPRFRYNVGAIQSIATSRGDDDGGLFSLNLEDERYLPFEGSGACGTFMLELPGTLRPLDAAAIADVVFNFRITARDGGGGFRDLVEKALRENLNGVALDAGGHGLFHAIDLRRDRPDTWHQLVTGGASSVSVTRDDLPYFASASPIAIAGARILARVEGAPATYDITVGGAALTLAKPPEPEFAMLLGGSLDGLALGAPLAIGTAAPALLKEAIIIVNYTLGA